MAEELEYLSGIDSEAEVQSAQLAVFMLFVALLVGQCMKHISIKFSVPYTPLLTVLGVALGIADRLWIEDHEESEKQAALDEPLQEPVSLDPGADPGAEEVTAGLEDEVAHADVHFRTT